MINRVLVVLAIVFVGLSILPYLLCRAWVNTIPLEKQGRRPDFDLAKPLSANGEL